MRRIYSPDIEKYDCYRSFLNDLIQAKEVKNSPMSYRFLAKKIGCSPSYLNDVVKGRTNLRLGKAMEISNFLCMDTASKASWILLVIKEIESPEVSDYFADQFKKIREVDLVRQSTYVSSD